MIKYFCDKCKKEITQENEFEHHRKTFVRDRRQESRLVGIVGGAEIEVSLLLPIQINFGFALCKYCIVDAVVKSLDDRTKERKSA